jgi:hypothetical protein
MTGVHEDQSRAERAAEGHHPLVAQPHSDEEGPIAEAEMLAAEMSSPTRYCWLFSSPFSIWYPSWDRRSPVSWVPRLL